MEKRSERKFLKLLNSKPVIGALIFITLSLVSVFAGNVIVKDGSIEVGDDFNSSGVLYVDSTNNRVGIGTLNPQSAFDVRGMSIFGNSPTTGNYASIDGDGDLSFTGTADYLVGNNDYAFRSSIDEDVGLFFNSNDLKYEFRNTSGNAVSWIELDGDAFFTGNIGIGTTTPTEKLDINSDAIRLRNSQTPTSSSATCSQGMIAWDNNYIYVCIATNTWKRSSLSTW